MSRLLDLRQELIIGNSSKIYDNILVLEQHNHFINKYNILFKKYPELLELYIDPNFKHDKTHIYIKCPTCKKHPLVLDSTYKPERLICYPLTNECKFTIKIGKKDIHLLESYFNRKQHLKTTMDITNSNLVNNKKTIVNISDITQNRYTFENNFNRSRELSPMIKGLSLNWMEESDVDWERF